MDLTALKDFIANATEQLANAEFERDSLEMALADKREEIQSLRDEISGLTLTATRLGLVEESDGTDDNVVPISGRKSLSSDGIPDLTGFNRTDAVAAVLDAEARPVDRAQIFDLALLGGADIENADQVSLALTNLKRSGRVEKLGDGRWRLIEQRRVKP